MKLSVTKLLILAPAALLVLSACKKDEEPDTTDYALDYDSSTLVAGFNLNPNDKVLAHLDSVFFSIDQVKAEIFNADSLPWGTDVRKLTVSVRTQRTATVEIIMPSLSDGQDVTVQPSDSINFSSPGGVMMRVTSNNGEQQRIYSVKVNVHQCNPDSLQWSTEPRTLPCINYIPDVREMQTIEFKDQVCMIARGESRTMMLSAADAGDSRWDAADIELPADAKINSLCATADALYMLTGSGDLLTSTDGREWTANAKGWSHLYGAYANEVIGLRGDGEWESYPTGRRGRIAPGMPVSGTSRMWTFTNDWAIAPMAMFAGGKDADGNASPYAWGFDGTNWSQLSGRQEARTLPAGEDYTLFPYFSFKINTTTYMVNKQSAWFAIGGKKADGKLSDKVYISLDNGVNWTEAPDDLQLPAAIAPRSMASIVLSYKTFNASRAITPITQWDAPYLYMFGGYKASGALYRQTWVGVINRLTFKPLQ